MRFQKQYLLIPLGIALFAIGMYISNVALDSIDPSGLSEMEFQNKVMSSDYPLGIGITALGATCFGIAWLWNYISSKQKRTESK